MPDVLLAKSRRPGRPAVTLLQHSLDAEQAVDAVFREGSRWRRAWLRFFRLGAVETAFFRNLRVACLFHDLGKANAGFLAAVEGKGEQVLRHEHLSALILHLPEVRNWLRAGGLDVEAITAAVLSHHLKAARGGDHGWCVPVGLHTQAPRLRVYLDHPEAQALLARVAAVAELAPPPRLAYSEWRAADAWSAAHREGLRASTLLAGAISADRDRRLFVAALKAGVIVCDSVASGLVREGHGISEWVADVAHGPALGPDAIEEAVLAPRAAQVAARTQKPFVLHSFQARAALLGPRGLLLAACGAGKTLAAWAWAKEQSREREVGRVVFLYPTRGTATEGYRDYAGWAPEGEAALVHATARYELDAMTDNPPSLAGKSVGLSEADARLYALGLWSRRYFSATVDQFMSFMEHGYTSLCLLPVLADAAIVVDEVHSFDPRMFENLTAFLEHFDVPVLAMTATLPPGRRTVLERCGLVPYPRTEDRAELADLEARERHPRYQLEQVDDPERAMAEAREAYRAGARVLWVVNRVAAAQALTRRLRDELGEVVSCYHSRYKLDDRRRIHGEVVAAFQQRGRASFAVTTQVCEMSLDLDADLLITELAPPTAMVQRFGRANRHAVPGAAFRASLLVYRGEQVLPYTAPELGLGQRLVDRFRGRAVSQADLAEALLSLDLAETAPDGTARFLSSGYFATPGSLRNTDGPSKAAVLDVDLARYVELSNQRKPTDGLMLSVPEKVPEVPRPRPDCLPRFVTIVSAETYEPTLGFWRAAAEQGGAT